MVHERLRRIVLDVNQGDPICGSISDETGPEEPFTGWIELSSKLHRLRAAMDLDPSDG